HIVQGVSAACRLEQQREGRILARLDRPDRIHENRQAAIHRKPRDNGAPGRGAANGCMNSSDRWILVAAAHERGRGRIYYRGAPFVPALPGTSLLAGMQTPECGPAAWAKGMKSVFGQPVKAKTLTCLSSIS